MLLINNIDHLIFTVAYYKITAKNEGRVESPFGIPHPFPHSQVLIYQLLSTNG